MKTITVTAEISFEVPPSAACIARCDEVNDASGRAFDSLKSIIRECFDATGNDAPNFDESIEMVIESANGTIEQEVNPECTSE